MARGTKRRTAETEIERRVDWSKYTNFRARRSKADLAALCSRLNQDQPRQAFSTPDKTGLYPIHWAAIHNRSDLIEFMVQEAHSPLKIRCLSRFLAHGSALHLAATNGCIEAASKLLELCRADYLSATQKRKSEPPSLVLEDNHESASNPVTDWLEELDSEGQTALMRCAAPKSRRMDTFMTLLRKNLWSLSSRPAEMALFLIGQGASWTRADSQTGMNLLHVAIVNDYPDIVQMLLVIDKSLALVPATPPKSESQPKPMVVEATPSIELDNGQENSTEKKNKKKKKKKKKEKKDEFLAIDLGEEEQEAEIVKPLIDRRFAAENLLQSGLTPLQLAIIYSRLNVISIIWNVAKQLNQSMENPSDSSEIVHRSGTSNESNQELGRILSRVFWSNRKEIFRFSRVALLKLLLFGDLSLLATVWVPLYICKQYSWASAILTGGFFTLFSCFTLALALKVIYENPGYLKQNSLEYMNELLDIVETAKDSSSVASTKRRLEERVRFLCHRCRCLRKPRSRHCNYCDRCIEEFDHHCIYLGCCIGRRNRLDFLIMLILLSMTAVFGSTAVAGSLHYSEWHSSNRRVWYFISFVWIFKYVLIGGVSAFLTLRRACLGVTMFEEIRSKRIRNIFGSAGAPAEIRKSHRKYSTQDSFWRYTPDRFITGDLSFRQIMANLREFTNFDSFDQWMLSLICMEPSVISNIMTNKTRSQKSFTQVQ